MTNTINQNTRKKLGISSVHYLILDVCSQYKNILRPTDAKSIADDTGLNPKAVSIAMSDLCKCEPRLLEQHETGNLYPTEHWYMSHFEEVKPITTLDESIAKDVVLYFNETNETRYQVPNNAELIINIIRQNPKLTMDHFKSVIQHKKETWGNDDKMREYNRPSTLFKNSNKFLRYLDDANIYWTTKAKINGYSQIR